jgi:hypothetical protein
MAVPAAIANSKPAVVVNPVIAVDNTAILNSPVVDSALVAVVICVSAW